jgi:tetratricopeptide (TPR) repeat protein
LLAVAPENVRVRRAHGGYLVMSGRHERGVETLRAVLDERPGDGMAQWYLGRGLAGLGRSAEAEACFIGLIDERPADWRGYSELGVERFRRRRFEEAAELLRVAVALNPSRARGWNNLGGIHHFLGHLSRAIEYFERSLQVEPSAHTWRNLGITYFRIWDHENAERALTEAVAIDPASHETWGALAAARQHLRDYEGAKEAYEEALRRGRMELELTPEAPLLLLDVAGYHGMLEHDEAARELIDEALALDGRDVVVLKEAGQAYEVIGERDRALELVEAALRGGYPLSRFEADPGLATFRSDPRYVRMLERLGLSGRD